MGEPTIEMRGEIVSEQAITRIKSTETTVVTAMTLIVVIVLITITIIIVITSTPIIETTETIDLTFSNDSLLRLNNESLQPIESVIILKFLFQCSIKYCYNYKKLALPFSFSV